VAIDIPSILVHLRGRVVRDAAEHGGVRGRLAGERLAMQGLARVFASRRRYEVAQKAGRAGQWPLARGGDRIEHAPGPLRAWTAFRDLRAVPGEAFRDWWRTRSS
jgi:L-lactate dehydrogenase complex protein LldF